MAKEVQSKKRKASVPEGEAEKMKKVKKVTTKDTGAPVKKRKATEEAAIVEVKKSKTPKATLKNATKPKLVKDVILDNAVEKTNSDSSEGFKSAAKESKPLSTTKTKMSKQPKPIEPQNDAEVDGEGVNGESDDSEIDDQTEALLRGFESDGDEEDAEKEGGLEPGQEVPEVPPISNRSKKQLKKSIDFKKDDKPGVVYVGHIPHGFYEHEMAEYFKQFGAILKLRMSRNRRTGASKHIAWIQFESSVVAEIVAKTMDNYLLFNHILKVKLVPDAQVPVDLWKGANKRFKKVPWNKIEGRKLAAAKPEEVWEALNKKEQLRRDKKAKKLEDIGYEFESPKLKSAIGIAKKPAEIAAAITDVEVKAIEAAPVPANKSAKETKDGNRKKDKKDKKDKKRKATGADETPATSNFVAPIEPTEEGSKDTKTESAEDADVLSKDGAKKRSKAKKVESAA